MTPDPELPPDYEVPEDDGTLLAECRVETFRAGGPGGQHQNKTESGVRLTHLPSGISVTARDSRSQHRNRSAGHGRSVACGSGGGNSRGDAAETDEDAEAGEAEAARGEAAPGRSQAVAKETRR